MDVLASSLEELRLKPKCHVDMRSLNKMIREILDKSDDEGVDKRLIKSWCEQVFLQIPQIPNELILLAWQVLLKFFPEYDHGYNYQDNAYMIVGRQRARLIYDRVEREEVRSITKGLLVILQQYISNRLMVSTIVDMAERVCTIDYIDNDELMILVAVAKETLWQQDELVLHRTRLLIVSLFGILHQGELWEELRLAVINIDADVKMKYLLLKDLLYSKICLDGFTNPPNLRELLEVLVKDKALASPISDCIVLLLLGGNYRIDDLMVIGDEQGLFGSHLFPRLVKRLPAESLELLTLLDMGDETSLRHYCSLYQALVSGENSFKVKPKMDVISKALTSYSEHLRLTAFSGLCKSVSTNDTVSDEFIDIIRTYLMDMLLCGTSDSRQQTMAALKYLIETHFCRLYGSYRQRTDDLNVEVEVEMICQFWRTIISLCKNFLSPVGYYNKNVLCLSIHSCFLSLWTEKLAKCPVPSLKMKLEELWKTHMVFPLFETSYINQLRDCLLTNTFDTIRQIAADLIKQICLIQGENPSWVVEYQSHLIDMIMPRLKDHRTHVIDGLSKLAKIIGDLDGNHGSYVDLFSKKLNDQIVSIDPFRLETLANSTALGLMTILRRLCAIVVDFVSHPSPESHLILSPFDENNDENEDDTEDLSDISFSVMTFCWRTIKISSSLMVVCLKNLTSATVKDLLHNGEFLVDIIMKIRHPGAFMSLARPLKDICQLCFGSFDQAVNTIPMDLLDRAKNICSIQPAVQTTRRSAGLPFCISSIVSASKDAQQRNQMLCHCIDLSEDGFDVLDASPFIIHNLNILRQIFRDSSLAEDVIPFIPKAFTICSRALTSPCWAVRNSGMMLFTALMNRTFGIRHDSEDYSHVNFVDPRSMYAKYGTLFRSADDFADFSILQRYRYSSGGEQSHGEFYISACDFALGKLACPKMKERKMTVRLLAHMCESQLLRKRILSSLDTLGHTTNTNLIHGLLLLLRTLEEKGYISSDEIQRLLNLVPKCCWDSYPIRVLLEENSLTMPQEMVRIEESIFRVRGRRLNNEQIDFHVIKLIDYVNSRYDDTTTACILETFESFWLEYDLEGSYRSTLIRNWRPLPLSRQVVRIWYLGLTDDDNEIRYDASINFGQKASIPHLLRFILMKRRDDIGNLLTFIPQWEGRHYNPNRALIFEPEPLNSFKDLFWEGQLISTKTPRNRKE